MRREVLLAEDDMEMRLLLSLELQKRGCAVIECENGVSLVEQLEPLLNGATEVEYDLIITDIRMPGITGMEIVEALARLPQCPPLILITAFGDEKTHDRARRLGVAAILDKPFEIQDFLSGVDEALTHSRASSGLS